jgi:hypothetical protein
MFAALVGYALLLAGYVVRSARGSAGSRRA